MVLLPSYSLDKNLPELLLNRYIEAPYGSGSTWCSEKHNITEHNPWTAMVFEMYRLKY